MTTGEKVVTIGTPRATSFAIVSSDMAPPCSMVSMPKSTARAIAASKVACAVTGSPPRCVSSTMARSSSSVNSSVSWHIMTLMRSAPSLICSRTARRISSAPLASRQHQ